MVSAALKLTDRAPTSRIVLENVKRELMHSLGARRKEIRENCSPSNMAQRTMVENSVL
jgi:hypothetical protein